MSRIDLNADLGEGFGPWRMGDDADMMSIVTSANIACGGHASDPETMYQTLLMARDKGVSVGAHPGYADLAGFGRRVIPMSPDEVGRLCAVQIGALMGIAAQAGVSVRYVKPHGALANLAARNRSVADAIVAAMHKIDPKLAMLAISGTQGELAARDAGVPVFSEIFADRGYLASGQLVPRGQAGDLIHDPTEASQRLIGFLESGLMPVVDGDPIRLDAHSICIHGDSAGAVAMARDIHARLSAHGVRIASFLDD